MEVAGCQLHFEWLGGETQVLGPKRGGLRLSLAVATVGGKFLQLLGDG